MKNINLKGIIILLLLMIGEFSKGENKYHEKFNILHLNKNGCLNYVNDLNIPAPPDISQLAVTTNECFEKVVLWDHPSENIKWYWQGTNNTGHSKDIENVAVEKVFGAEAFYIRAYDEISGQWSSPSLKILNSLFPPKGIISGGTINGDQSICYNSVPHALTNTDLPIVIQSSNPHIMQWQRKPRIGGVWEDIQYEHNKNYTPQTPLLKSTLYRRKVSMGGCAVKYSNEILVIVQQDVQPGHLVNEGKTITIKKNTSPGTIKNHILPMYGDGNYEYSWHESTDGINWDYIYAQDIDYTPGALDNDTYFRRGVESCYESSYTNPVFFNVEDFTLSGVSAERCGHGSVTLSVSGEPEGLNYQWFENNEPIEGAVNKSLETPSLFLSKTYQVAVINEVGTELERVDVTATIKYVKRPKKPHLIAACGEGADKLQRDPNDNDPNFKYYWQSTSLGTDASFFDEEFTPLVTGIYYLRAKEGDCWSDASIGVAVLINNESPDDEANNPTVIVSPTIKSKGALPTQTNIGNYVRTYDALEAEKNKESLNLQIAKNKAQITTAYVDGLGRATQSIVKEGSPSGKDIVQLVNYDNKGRQVRTYLPYVDTELTTGTNGLFKPQAFDEQYEFYTDQANNIATTGVAYAEKEIENSPLNRVLAEFAPGESWVGSKGTNNEIKVGYKTRTNRAFEVYDWKITSQGEPFVGQYNITIPKGTLLVTEIKDEHNNITLEYKNKLGQVILKKVQMSGDEVNPVFAQTYYIYDLFGNLRAVLPPQFIEEVSDIRYQDMTDLAHEYAFLYIYDERQRLIRKKVPGTDGFVEMVYDKLDRLMLTQDPVQKTNNEWTFTKYDILSRPVMSGVFSDPGTDPEVTNRRGYFQSLVNAQENLSIDHTAINHENILTGKNIVADKYEGHTAYIASESVKITGNWHFDAKAESKNFSAKTDSEIVNNASWVEGYFDETFPSSEYCELLTVTYYDSYDFSSTGIADYQYNNSFDSDFVGVANAPEVFNRVKGQVTGSKVKNLKTGNWLTSVTFYDDKGRVIQTQSKNHLGGTDVLTTSYDFTGKVLQTVLHHQANGNAKKIEKFYDYDHAGRLLAIKQQIDDHTEQEQVITKNTYNEIGELVSNDLGGDVQTVDYQYNIRGWMTDINDVDNLGLDDVFAMKLSYETGFQKGQYNGNISGQRWKTASSDLVRAYGYQYDKLNRLKRADYRADDGSQNWNQEKDQFTTFDIQYDFNGNILSMARQGLTTINENTQVKTFAAMDRLVYTYKGNQLLAVDDKIDNNTKGLAKDFYDKDIKYCSAASEEYAYDENGNLIEDHNKGIEDIDYNHLNLPKLIDFGNGKKIEYVYDAAGIKLQKIVTDNGDIKVTDYIGEFVYENNELQFIHMDEGRIVPEKINGVVVGNGVYDYEYTLKDHLGNARVTTSNKQIKYKAGLENDDLEVEKKHFGNLQETQILGIGRGGSNASSLVKEGQDGPVKTIKVAKGDEVEATVWGLFYEEGMNMNYTYGSGNILNPNPDGSSSTPIGLVGSKSSGGSTPNAYLKMMFTPEGSGTGEDDFISIVNVAGEFKQIGLVFNVETAGELSIFVVNESSTDVIFDDFEIKHKQKVVQENHYYGFGMQISGIGKEGSNKYLYNGKEEQNDFDLNWSDYGARIYDSQIGKFIQIDPLSDYREWLSPTNFVQNNPINRIDPTGKIDDWVEDSDGNITWRDEVTSSGDKDLKTGEIYRGARYRRFENVGENTYNDVVYNADKTISRTRRQRPDADGIVTDQEAIEWYHFGGGVALTVDISQFDFRSSNLAIQDFNERGRNALSVNFFNAGNIHFLRSNIIWRPASDETLSDVYGTIRLAIVNADIGEVRVVTREDGSFDTYDFSLIGSVVADLLRSNGNPTPFNFMPEGTGTIRITRPE